jgi:hypothetical protein
MTLDRKSLAMALLAAILAFASPADAALQANVDRQEVLPGETITLTIRQDDLSSAREPDLRVLEKDFQVLDVRRSQQVQIINGDRSESMDWVVVLLPNNAGVSAIPSLRVGAETTAPIAIRMVALPRGETDSRPELFVEAEIETAEGFVGAEVLYTVRVYDQGKMQSGTLRPPEVPGAAIESSGDSTSREVILDGQRYNLHEQQFRITPEEPGTLQIAPAILEARMQPKPGANRRRTRGFFNDFFDRAGLNGPLRRVASNPITFEVRARPDSTEGWFLPAKLVQLGEVWSAESGDLRLGDALTRTVTLRVLGATSEQLPAFVIPGPTGARQYAEGTRQGTRPTADGTISVREESVSIVPTAAGTLEFPAVEIKWFDIDAEEAKVARLPARSFEILPPIGQAGVPSAPAEAMAKAPIPPNNPLPKTTALALPGRTAAMAIALMLGGIGLVTLILLRLRQSRQSGIRSPRLLRRDVLSACRISDAQGARTAFLKWAEAVMPRTGCNSLIEIGKGLGDEPLSAALRELNQSLYGQDAEPWSGKAMAAAFRSVARTKSAGRPESGSAPLPSLYPSS